MGVLAVGLALGGCAAGGGQAAGPGVGQGAETAGPGVADGWPSGAPADIPAFPGHLETYLSGRQGGSGLVGARLFFTDVSEADFAAYRSTLQDLGYDIEGVVQYSENGSQENAQRRADAGDIDAIVATKGDRRLTVTVPYGGTVSFDMDGLTAEELDAVDATAPGLQRRTSEPATTPGPAEQAPAVRWPEQWTDRLPEPQGCTVEASGILTVSATTLAVECGYPDADPTHGQSVLDAYVAQLQAVGFVRDEAVGPAMAIVTLRRGSTTVVLLPHDDLGMLSITAMGTE
jgi:hypothetical protein